MALITIYKIPSCDWEANDVKLEQTTCIVAGTMDKIEHMCAQWVNTWEGALEVPNMKEKIVCGVAHGIELRKK